MAVLGGSSSDPRSHQTPCQSSMSFGEQPTAACSHRCVELVLPPADERGGWAPRAGSWVHRPEGLHQAELIEWAEVVGHRAVAA